jgi:hypothetical protein
MRFELSETALDWDARLICGTTYSVPKDGQAAPMIRAFRFASIWNPTLRLPNDGLFTRGAEAGRAWT